MRLLVGQQGVQVMIDLQSLRYIVLVADHHSFRKAAIALGVHQTAIGRRVRSLEDAIGVSIFERRSGGAYLTCAGTEFLAAIRRVLQEIDTAISVAGVAGLGATGRITVGWYASLSSGELRATLVDYIGRYPAVMIRVVEGSRSRLIASLKSKEIDIAIVTGKVDRMIGDAMSLWSERIMVAVPQEHPLAAHSRIHWQDLRGERFLLTSQDPAPEIHDILIGHVAAGDKPTILSHDVSRENVLSMVGAGQGISLLHECGTGATYPGVVYREIYRDGEPTLVDNVAYWLSANDNPAFRRFLSLLRERYPGGTRVP
jgi:DNA-binding transcriptional LysR family regulator